MFPNDNHVEGLQVRQIGHLPQLFSDPGKTGTPFLGKPFFVGQHQNKVGKIIGATEPLSYKVTKITSL